MQVDQGLPPIEGGVPVPVEDYAYDEEGNRTASHLSALYTSNAHNQLEEDEAYSYAYDPRGNRVSKTSKATGAVETYAYDSQNRLVWYANATLSARYAYDALDRRIAKIIDGPGEDINPPGQAEPYALKLISQGALDVPDLTIDGPFTIETWIRLEPGQVINHHDGLMRSGTDQPTQDLNFAAGRLRLYAPANGGDVIIANSTATAGVWTHYAVTRDDSGRLRIYIDGALDVTSSGNFTAPFHVGFLGRTAAGVSNAQYDEFRIWSVARSEAQIAAARGAVVDSNTQGLERLYRFDESLTEVRDATGSTAPSALGAGVTIVPSTAPAASLPEAPAAPGPNAEVTAFVLDQDTPNPMDTSNIVLEFGGVAQSELSARWLFSSKVDEPLEVEKYADASQPGSGTTYTLVGDHQGSITQIVNTATGSRIAQYSYGAYGARSSGTADLVQSYGYTGREYDAESGLYHLRWRAYDPATGTFMQMDPLGFGGGQENLYAYVDNDPFNATDPMGLIAIAEHRVQVHGEKQALASATRQISAGLFSTVGDLIEKGLNWNQIAGYFGEPMQAPQLAPPTNNNCSANSHESERGQHLYVIYNVITGKARKFGIGNEKELRAGGSQSARDMRQLRTNEWHAVLFIIPSGFLARGQAAIVEQMMVSFMSTLNVEVTGQGRPGPKPDYCPVGGKY